MVWFVPSWRGGTRILPASTFRFGRWQSHLMIWPVCCISPLTACSCPTGPYHGTRRWNWWRRTWGLVWVILLKRSKRPKVHIADLATWRGSSRSVWRNRGIWKPSMVWLRRCGGCGTRLSAYICYTWWGSRSSLTRASGLSMLCTWGTLETLILLLLGGELRHYFTCIRSSTMLHVGTAIRWQDTWLCCRYNIKTMFYFLKCKCIWFVYL